MPFNNFKIFVDGMVNPLMPKATAVWLIENTSLTFEQIAEFCGLHLLEIKGIADGEVARGIIGLDPVQQSQLTMSEIKRCEADPRANLTFADAAIKLMNEQKQKKTAKYIHMSKRQEKPEAIAWLLKNCPEMTDMCIAKLIGSTKKMVLSIRDKTYWNIANIGPKDPVLLGLCSQTELNAIYANAKSKVAALNKSEALS